MDTAPSMALEKVARMILRDSRTGRSSMLITSARVLDDLPQVADQLRNRLGEGIQVEEANGYLASPPTEPSEGRSALIVSRARSCRRRDLERTRDTLQRDGYRVLGTVLVDGTDPLPRFLRHWFPAS